MDQLKTKQITCLINGIRQMFTNYNKNDDMKELNRRQISFGLLKCYILYSGMFTMLCHDMNGKYCSFSETF